MNILVVGGGGREHAIVTKLRQSSHVSKVYCVPGNAGIAKEAICEPISPEDIDAILSFARSQKIDFTVVGPELPLVAGIVDAFEANGMPIFGPTKVAAELEGSKAFAKYLMRTYDIPTADYEVFTDYKNARDYLNSSPLPVVVKADGLAAGKGAVVCQTLEEANEALQSMMEEKRFGTAGNKVVIEECLMGEEISVLAISDGENLVYLAPSQDHKRIYDNDEGPNTGGMGAYAPAPQVDDELMQTIKREVMEKTIKGMALEGRPYKGVLYAGLMLTSSGPKVLEFNCRFGDPETQVILPLAESDLLEALMASRDGLLADFHWRNKDQAAVCVVLASGGYPGSYEKGKPIWGLESSLDTDILVFHAGTQQQNNQIVTHGGRVLGITALADTLKSAQARVYEAVGKITFDGAYYRRDIADKALKD